MIFCFVRETKQLTLEEIDRKWQTRHQIFGLPTDSVLTEVFSVPTKTFLHHEVTVSMPYILKRHVLRRNIPKPPPLIEKAQTSQGA